MGMVAIRALLATLVLYALLRLRGQTISRSRSTWITGLMAGVFQLSVPFLLFTFAYQYASAGFVGLLIALIPLATAIAAHFMLPDEPLHAAKVVGLAVAFSGVGLLLLSGDSGLEEGGRPFVATALSAGAVASIAYASVFTKGRPHGYDPVELTWMQFLVGIFLVGGAMFVWEGVPTEISRWGWTLIVYLTLAGSVLPFLLFYWVLQRASSTKASLVGYFVPLIALLGGIILLDEKLQFGIAAGGLLILVGTVLTDRAERSRAPFVEARGRVPGP
jgi:drug/metabolite transporter (DMT)-like permease